jgi:hypothetical protein
MRTKETGTFWRVNGRDYVIGFGRRWIDLKTGLPSVLSYDDAPDQVELVLTEAAR